MRACTPTLLLVAFAVLFLASCGGERPAWLERFLSSPAQNAAESLQVGEEVDIKELEADIRRFESVIKEKIEAAEGAVTAHRLLAEQYNKLEMYILALEHYEEILRIEPANAAVLNSAGIAAGQAALSRPGLEEKEAYLDRARRYYDRSIDINPAYRDPYFALAVLYLFEFEDTEAAKAVLARALPLFPDDSRMLFLLARIAVEEERIDDAIEIYDHIVRKSTLESEKNAALANREELLNSY